MRDTMHIDYKSFIVKYMEPRTDINDLEMPNLKVLSISFRDIYFSKVTSNYWDQLVQYFLTFAGKIERFEFDFQECYEFPNRVMDRIIDMISADFDVSINCHLVSQKFHQNRDLNLIILSLVIEWDDQ